MQQTASNLSPGWASPSRPGLHDAGPAVMVASWEAVTRNWLSRFRAGQRFVTADDTSRLRIAGAGVFPIDHIFIEGRPALKAGRGHNFGYGVLPGCIELSRSVDLAGA